MEENLLVGDILNHLINNNDTVLDQRQYDRSKLQEDHINVGASIWESVKSYVAYAKNTGAEWMAVVIEKIYSAFESIGAWMASLNEKYFVRVTMQFWKDLAVFAKDMIAATADVVIFLFESFRQLFMHLFSKTLGTFSSATESVKGWVQEIASIISVNVQRATKLLVEPFKLIGSLLNAFWIPVLMNKQSTLVDTTCLALVTSLCGAVTQTYNVDVYSDLASTYELYGKSIALSRTLGVYEREHTGGNTTHHEQFIERMLKIGKNAHKSFPDAGYGTFLSTSLLLQLQDSWSAYLGKPNLKIQSGRDMFKLAKKVLRLLFKEDVGWWGEVARSMFNTDVLRETLAQIFPFLRARYSPFESETHHSDTPALSDASLEKLVAEYNKRPSKNPKIAQKLKTFLLIDSTQKDLGNNLDEEARSKLLKQILESSMTQHEALKRNKNAQIQRDKFIDTLASDEEKIAAIPLDSTEIQESTLALINLQRTLEGYGLVPNGKKTEFVRALTLSANSAAIANKMPAQTSQTLPTSLWGDIDHWHKQKDRRIAIHFQEYLYQCENTIKAGQPVLNFCEKRGVSLNKADVERYGVTDSGNYIFFVVYAKMSQVYDNRGSTEVVQDMYDKLTLALKKNDRILRLLALDDIMSYVGYGIGFFYLGLQIAISVTGALKPVNPFITHNSVQPVKGDLSKANLAMQEVDKLLTAPQSTLNPFELSLVKLFTDTKVTVDGRTGGINEFRGFLGHLNVFANSNAVEASPQLERVQYEWSARVAFEFMNRIVDRNIEDISSIMKNFYNNPGVNHKIFMFNGSSQSNILTHTDQLANFAFNVVRPMFPNIDVYNVDIAGKSLQGYWERFYSQQNKSSRDFTAESNTKLGIVSIPKPKPVPSTSSPLPSSSSTSTPSSSSSSSSIEPLLALEGSTGGVVPYTAPTSGINEKPLPSNLGVVPFQPPVPFSSSSSKTNSEPPKLLSSPTPSTSETRPQPSYRFTPQKVAETESNALEHLEFYDTAIATQLANHVHLFQEAQEKYNIYLNLQVVALEYENLLTAIKGISSTKAPTLNAYVKTFSQYPKRVDAFKQIFGMFDYDMSPQAVITHHGSLLNDATEKISSVLSKLRVVVHYDSGKNDIIQGRADDITNGLAKFFDAFNDEQAYRNYQSALANEVPRNQEDYVKYSQAQKRVTDVLSILKPTLTGVFANNPASQEIYAEFQERQGAMEELVAMVNPDSDHTYRFLDIRRKAQPYLARLHVLKENPNGADLVDFISNNAFKLNDPNTPHIDRLEIAKTTMALMDDPKNHVIRSAFFQSLAPTQSAQPGSDVNEGLNVFVAGLNDFFHGNDAKKFSDTISGAMDLVPRRMFQDGNVLYDIQCPIALDVSLSMQAVLESYTRTHGITQTQVASVQAAITRGPEFNKLVYNTILWTAILDNPYSSPEQLANAIIAGKKLVFNDWHVEEPVEYHSEFNVMSFFNNGVAKLRATQDIVTGAAFSVPYHPEEFGNDAFLALQDAAIGTSLDPVLTDAAGQGFLTSETHRLFMTHFKVLLDHSVKEARASQLNIWSGLSRADQVQTLRGLKYTGNLEEMRAAYMNPNTDPGWTNTTAFLSYYEDFHASQRARYSKHFHHNRIKSQDISAKVHSLSSLLNTKQSTDSGESFFTIAISDSLQSILKDVLADYVKNQEGWRQAKAYMENFDLAFVDFFTYYMTTTLEYHDYLKVFPVDIEDESMKDIYTSYINSIFYQKLCVKIDELMSKRTDKVGVSEEIGMVLEQVKDALSGMANIATYRFTGGLSMYGITDLQISYDPEHFGTYTKENIDILEGQIGPLVTRLRDYYTSNFFTIRESVHRWTASLFSNKWTAIQSLKHLGKRSLSVVGTGLYFYSAYNSVAQLTQHMTNLDALMNTNTALSTFITGGINPSQFFITAKRIKPTFTYDSTHTIFSAYAQRNTARWSIPKQQQKDFLGIRRAMQRMYSTFVDWDKTDTLKSAIWNIASYAISLEFSFQFIKQLTQFFYHWYDNSVQFSFDVSLPGSAMAVCAAGSLALFLGDKLFSNALVLLSKFETDDLFLSFPSLKGHTKGLAFFKSLTTIWHFTQGLSQIFREAPAAYNSPLFNDTQAEDTFMSAQKLLSPGSASFMDNVMWGLSVSGQTLSVGITAHSVYSFFKPGGFDLVDATKMFKMVLETEFPDRANLYLLDNSTFKFTKSDDVNTILKTDGILWLKSNQRDPQAFDRRALVTRYKDRNPTGAPVNQSVLFYDKVIQKILVSDGEIVLKSLNKTENNIQLVDFVTTFVMKEALKILIPLL